MRPGGMPVCGVVVEPPVFSRQLLEFALERVNATPLGLNEALLVLNDGRQLLQVDHRLERVLQQARHAAAGPRRAPSTGNGIGLLRARSVERERGRGGGKTPASASGGKDARDGADARTSKHKHTRRRGFTCDAVTHGQESLRLTVNTVRG